MLIEQWQEIHKDDIGINGILANIQECIIKDDGLAFRLRFTNRTGMQDDSKFYISFYDPYGSFRISEDGKKHPFHVQNNTSYIIYNRRFAAETLVQLCCIYMSRIILRDSFEGLCADVIDGSGTLKGREATGRSYNIHPSNLRMTTHIDNLRKGQHI